MPAREHQVDACPGALRVHQAADGGVARIRLPGGALTARQLGAVLGAATEFGDGTLELTSRGNLQIRRLAAGAETALSGSLAAAGLLPSATHERVRNIIASPLTGRDALGLVDVRGLVRELDAELCAGPEYAALPGRFLFTVDDGRGDVAWLDADVATLFVSAGTAAILVGGRDAGLRADASAVVPAILACATVFLELRSNQWRIAELEDGSRRIAERLPALAAPGPLLSSQPPTRHAPLGQLEHADGLVSIGAAVPLGRLDRVQGALLADCAQEFVITPWRTIVVTDLRPEQAGTVAERLAAAGLLLDPHAPGVGVTACVGKPGCAKALADVRSDAAAMLPLGAGGPLPVHWSGCSRRCGRPRGRVLDVVATGDGYRVGGDERVLPGTRAAELAASVRKRQ